MDSFQIKDIVKHFVGQSNTLAVPAIFKKWLGTYNNAVLFAQIIYWSERTTNADGWFFKSYKDWENEIFLTEKEARTAVENLENLGLIETKVAKVQGTPTKHFRLKSDVFEAKFTDFLKLQHSAQVIENKGADGNLPKGSLESYQKAVSYSSQNLHTNKEIEEEEHARPRERENPHSETNQSVQNPEADCDVFAASDDLHRFPQLSRMPMRIERVNECAEFLAFVADQHGRRRLFNEEKWIDLFFKLKDEGMSVNGMKCLHRFCVDVKKHEKDKVSASVMDWRFEEYKQFVQKQQAMALNQ